MPATMGSSLVFVPLWVSLDCNGVVGRMIGLDVRRRMPTSLDMNLGINSIWARGTKGEQGSRARTDVDFGRPRNQVVGVAIRQYLS